MQVISIISDTVVLFLFLLTHSRVVVWDVYQLDRWLLRFSCICTLLQNEIDSSKNPIDYQRPALAATFFVGLFSSRLIQKILVGNYVTLFSFRLGFLIKFLSHAAI